MSEDEQVIETTFTIKVYSKGPLELAQRDDDPFQLLALNYEICEGPCVGDVTFVKEEIVPKKDLKKRLIAIGNDGEFFNEF